MKIRLYTHYFDTFLDKNNDPNSQISSDEHASLTEKRDGNFFINLETILSYYLNENYSKLSALQFLINYLKSSKYRNIISFGSHASVLEWLLKLSLGDSYQVSASDYDKYVITYVKKHFTNIKSFQLDFLQNNIEQICRTNCYDFAIAFGSLYVLDDNDFISFLKALKASNTIKEIVDFHSGYIGIKSFMKNSKIGAYFINNLIKKDREKLLGKFHGYGRSKTELRRIYKASGWEVKKEFSVGPYKYVAILK